MTEVSQGMVKATQEITTPSQSISFEARRIVVSLVSLDLVASAWFAPASTNAYIDHAREFVGTIPSLVPLSTLAGELLGVISSVCGFVTTVIALAIVRLVMQPIILVCVVVVAIAIVRLGLVKRFFTKCGKLFVELLSNLFGKFGGYSGMFFGKFFGEPFRNLFGQFCAQRCGP